MTTPEQWLPIPAHPHYEISDRAAGCARPTPRCAATDLGIPSKAGLAR
jgi:hypothetical protein